VGVEPAILDRQNRLHERPRDLPKRHERAVLLEELVHELLVPVVDERLDRRGDGLEIGRRGEIFPEPVGDPDADPDHAAEHDDEHREQEFRDASPA